MIRKKQPQKELVIDLTGPKGNVFYLLGQARQLADQLEFNTDEILDEMQSDDYEHLVETFDKYFGDFVVLER